MIFPPSVITLPGLRMSLYPPWGVFSPQTRPPLRLPPGRRRIPPRPSPPRPSPRSRSSGRGPPQRPPPPSPPHHSPPLSDLSSFPISNPFVTALPPAEGGGGRFRGPPPRETDPRDAPYLQC